MVRVRVRVRAKVEVRSGSSHIRTSSSDNTVFVLWMSSRLVLSDLVWFDLCLAVSYPVCCSVLCCVVCCVLCCLVLPRPVLSWPFWNTNQ